LGSQWTGAADVLAATSIWAAWQFVASPLSTIMTAREAAGRHSFVQSMLFALRLGGLVIGYVLGSAWYALLLFSIGSVAGYAFYLFSIAKVSGAGAKAMARAIAPALGLSIVGATLALLAAQVSDATKYAIVGVVTIAWLLATCRALKRAYRQRAVIE
jgi:hypothetical protein